MRADKTALRTISRIIWIGLFFTVSATLAWLEWSLEAGSAMGWFLAVGLWSAVCGIGYSVAEWWIAGRGVKVRRHE